MKRAAVLGKGQLAAHACDVLAALPDTVLDTVIPNRCEPDWDLRLSQHVAEHHPDARLISSGRWHDLEPGRCDLVVSVLYDEIIGNELIDATDTIVNCHPGRLPQYRGARPVNWALRNGEPLHGATLHVIETGIDTGPILGEVAFSIWPDTDEVRDVWQRTMRHAALLLSDTLPRLNEITPRPKDEALAVTHYLRDSHQLGSRSNWTRATSTSL
ncbi:formyltransferase family protein [Streptomyces sp. NPDC057623]|uniref:formyltransferase family protein n=1 Tax=Streptomyces sp. NPDC057623 TaxID=3346187 RepID=UPI00367CB6B1